MSARREHAEMIQILVEDERVDFGELIQVGFGRRVELDLRGQLDFVALPAFDSYRSTRGADDSDCPAKTEAHGLLSRRRSLD